MYLPALANALATSVAEIPVQHQRRAVGGSRYNLFGLLRLAADLVIGFSLLPIRLIGVGVSGLTEPEQMPLSLFESPSEDRTARLNAAFDRLDHRFGKKAVRRAGSMVGDEIGRTESTPRQPSRSRPRSPSPSPPRRPPTATATA